MLALAASGVSYHLGETRGIQSGFAEGYTKGQVDFAAEIYSALNETIDTKSVPQTYRHFKDVKDITLYVVTRNGVKTIAVWKAEMKKQESGQ
jgi:hypothetical protein